MSDITWAPMIPLIGGFPLGAEAAFKKPPVGIYSFGDFAKNDSHYEHYVNKTKGYKVPYIDMAEEFQGKQIDVIVGTPPCAALSQLNTGKNAEVKGAGCQKNEWMYRVFEEGIDTFGARAVVVENAPALYTNKGRGVADRLYKIASDRGYSLTLYKTSTMYHGIPQNRQRAFAIAWDSKTAPVMGWYKRDRKGFKEYLEEVPEDALQQDLVINPSVYTDHYFQYIQHRENKDPRELMIEQSINTAFQFVQRNYGLIEALDWFKKTDNEKGQKYAAHALKKFEIGKGIWDGSTHVFDDVMNAVIGRNMVDTIHPTQNRSLTVREALHMMGFPMDFELLRGKPSINHIAQNVPVCTARDICTEIGKYISGSLLDSGSSFVKQNNFKETVEHVEYERNELTSFFV